MPSARVPCLPSCFGRTRMSEALSKLVRPRWKRDELMDIPDILVLSVTKGTIRKETSSKSRKVTTNVSEKDPRKIYFPKLPLRRLPRKAFPLRVGPRVPERARQRGLTLRDLLRVPLRDKTTVSAGDTGTVSTDSSAPMDRAAAACCGAPEGAARTHAARGRPQLGPAPRAHVPATLHERAHTAPEALTTRLGTPWRQERDSLFLSTPFSPALRLSRHPKFGTIAATRTSSGARRNLDPGPVHASSLLLYFVPARGTGACNCARAIFATP